MNYFPYGRAAFSILILALLSGSWLLLHPSQKHKATLTYWTFTPVHYAAYQQILPEFEREHPGVTVDLQLVSLQALSARMQSAMLANLDVPDLFEIEAGQAGAASASARPSGRTCSPSRKPPRRVFLWLDLAPHPRCKVGPPYQYLMVRLSR